MSNQTTTALDITGIVICSIGLFITLLALVFTILLWIDVKRAKIRRLVATLVIQFTIDLLTSTTYLAHLVYIYRYPQSTSDHVSSKLTWSSISFPLVLKSNVLVWIGLTYRGIVNTYHCAQQFIWISYSMVFGILSRITFFLLAALINAIQAYPIYFGQLGTKDQQCLVGLRECVTSVDQLCNLVGLVYRSALPLMSGFTLYNLLLNLLNNFAPTEEEEDSKAVLKGGPNAAYQRVKCSLIVDVWLYALTLAPHDIWLAIGLFIDQPYRSDSWPLAVKVTTLWACCYPPLSALTTLTLRRLGYWPLHEILRKPEIEARYSLTDNVSSRH